MEHERTQKSNSKVLVFLVLTIFLINLSSAINVDFVSPTPTSGSTINTRNFIINATIDTPNPLSSIIYTWNNMNYSIYDDSLVLYYNFDNRSSLGENNTHVKDISRYGNNGTVVGGNNISWNQNNGKYNGAFNFSGNIGYINSSYIGLLNNSQAFTISFWVYLNNNSASTRILSIGEVSAGTPTKGIEFYGDASNLNFGFNNQTSAGTVNISSVSYTKNNWYHLVGVFNGTHIKFYKNNFIMPELTGTRKISFPSITNTQQLVIGIRSSTLTTQMLNGSLDNLMIWNRSLNTEEISLLYNSQLTKFNNTNFNYILNQSNLTISNNYNLYVNDSSNNLNQTNRLIRLLNNINLTSINSYPISSYLYGANIHTHWGSNLSYVEVSGVRVLSNYTWHREQFDILKLNNFRMDMGLASTSLNETSFNITALTSNYVNINTMKNIVEYAIQTNRKITFIADQPIPSNRNVTAGCIGSNSTCAPLNYTSYANNVVNFLNYVGCTSDVCDVEVYNEPYDKLLINESRTSPNITLIYNQIYNITYDKIKVAFPTMKVGANLVHFGFGNSDVSYYNYTNFLSNFPNKINFITAHMYWDEGIYAQLQTEYDDLKTACTTYSAQCSDIRLGEINSYNPLYQNNSLYFINNQNILSQYYLFSVLNNISVIQIYQWSSIYNYNVTAQFDNYPRLYSFVSEPQLDNRYYVPYNITYKMSRYLASSSIVYNTTIDTDEFIAVYSEKSGKKNIVVTNKVNQKQNITLNCLSYTGQLIDTSNGNLFSCASGSVNLGVLDEYDVKYYTEPSILHLNGTDYYNNYLGEYLGYSVYIGQNNQDLENTNMEMCSYFSDGLGDMAGFIPKVFLILGVIVVLAVVVILMFVIKNIDRNGINNFAMDEIPTEYIMAAVIGIGVLIFVCFAALFATSIICQIQF